MKEITARLWENKMYGTTYAKGQYRKAIYNGTLEIIDPYAKYLVDFEEIEAWFHFAKSPVHIEMASRLGNIPINEDHVLMSWIYLNCYQFRSTTKESFSIVNYCSNMG